MRHLLFLVIGLVALGGMLPRAVPAVARPMAHGIGNMANPPCHESTPCVADHVCIGCAARPADPARIAAIAPLSSVVPVASDMSVPEGHRPGFDPPPPRIVG